MAIAYYNELDVSDAARVQKNTYYEVNYLREYLKRALKHKEEVIDVIGWEPPVQRQAQAQTAKRRPVASSSTLAAAFQAAEKPDTQQSAATPAGPVWITLNEDGLKNVTDGTFRAFLDDDVETVYEVPAGMSPRDAVWGDAHAIVVKGRDVDGARLHLDRQPQPDSSLALRPITWVLRCQLAAIDCLQNAPQPGYEPLLQLFQPLTYGRSLWGAGSCLNWRTFLPHAMAEDDWLVLKDPKWPGGSRQREFVCKALATPDFALLNGPPGSGKTQVICELILQCVKRGQRVLLCASTHVAVDNVVERLKSLPKDQAELVHPLRIASNESNVRPAVQPYCLKRVVRTACEALLKFLREQTKPSAAQRQLLESIEAPQEGDDPISRMVLDDCNVHCGTTIGILQHPEITQRQGPEFRPRFDVLIIDEASKTTFQEFLVPALLATRWVLVGDPLQLSPYVEEKDLQVQVRASLGGAMVEDRNVEELAWRLVQAYTLSREPESRQVRLRDDLARWLPEQGREVHLAEMNRLCRIAMPSVIEAMCSGIGRFKVHQEQNYRTTLTDGFPDEPRDQRYVLLTHQHRMHPEIAAFPCKHIYHGAALQTEDTMMLEKRAWAYTHHHVRAIWLDVRGVKEEKSMVNRREADEILKELHTFAGFANTHYRSDGQHWEVAVLSFYRDQERELRRRVEQDKQALASLNISVCTVDRFQGREADLVVLSFVRDLATSFLESVNRLNVAITRARYQLIVVGNRPAMKRSQSAVLQALATDLPNVLTYQHREAVHA